MVDLLLGLTRSNVSRIDVYRDTLVVLMVHLIRLKPTARQILCETHCVSQCSFIRLLNVRTAVLRCAPIQSAVRHGVEALSENRYTILHDLTLFP